MARAFWVIGLNYGCEGFLRGGAEDIREGSRGSGGSAWAGELCASGKVVSSVFTPSGWRIFSWCLFWN